MNSQNKIPAGLWLPFLLLTIAALLVLSGCTSTVIPPHVEASAPSFDPSGAQNSGFLGWTNFEDAHVGIITEDARERYNLLVAQYGRDFLPPLNQDQGLRQMPGTNTWFIMPAALVDFSTMNRWRKEGRTK